MAYASRPISEHLQAYLEAPIRGRKSRRRAPLHLHNIEVAISRAAQDCGWKALRDVGGEEFDRWMQVREEESA